MDKWEKNGDSKVDTKVVAFTKHASVSLFQSLRLEVLAPNLLL